MGKRIKMSMGVGASSLIMIFVVLATVTLATLAFGTARADYKLAEKSAESVRQFYEADCRAEEILAKVNQILKETPQAMWQQELSKIPELTAAQEKEQLMISYQIPVGNKQNLNVALAVSKKNKSGEAKCYITAFQIESNQEWNYEEGLGFEELVIGK